MTKDYFYGRSLADPEAKLESAMLREAIWRACCRALTFAACIGVLVGVVALYSKGAKADEATTWADVRASADELGLRIRAFSESVDQLQKQARALRVTTDIPVHVYEEGRTSIRLMGGPCVQPMILGFVSQAGPQYVERLRAVESTWPHKDGSVHEYAGCWLELSAEETGGGAAFFVIFSDGHRFVVDKAEFLKGKGAGT